MNFRYITCFVSKNLCTKKQKFKNSTLKILNIKMLNDSHVMFLSDEDTSFGDGSCKTK